MFIDVFLWLGLPATLIAIYYALRDEFGEYSLCYRQGWAKRKETRKR